MDRGVRVVLTVALALQIGIQAAIVDNLSHVGPDRPSILWLGLVLLLAGAAAFALVWLATTGPWWSATLVLLAVLAVAVELLPEKIDSHESFLERPNGRSACHGLTYTSYPWGTMDASETVWCVGWESALPPG